jgi:hypothetical protein
VLTICLTTTVCSPVMVEIPETTNQVNLKVD